MSSFFSTVHNVGFSDKSPFGYAESAANICRAPRRWFLTDCGFANKEHYVSLVNGQLETSSKETAKSKGLQKVIRMIFSAVFIIPGEMFGTSLMSAAYLSSRVRQKHAFTEKQLNTQEQAELKKKLEESKKLSDQRQGCEPISCLLCSILFTLCCCMHSAKGTP